MVVLPIKPATEEDKGWIALGVGIMFNMGDFG
jgi:hypothetical protein